MKNRSPKWIAPAVGIGVGLWLLLKTRKVAAFDQMRFLINRVSLSGNVFTPELNIALLAQNPTDEDIAISSLLGDVYVNDSKIGNVSSFTPFTLLPNSETPFTVKARVSVTGILSQLGELLNGVGGAQPKVRISGTVNADGTVIPVDLNTTIL